VSELGYASACGVLERGRTAFFGDAAADLPVGRSRQLQLDDLTPQFGFVGQRYTEARVLLLGINPGNGPSDDLRTSGDELMMPAMHEFAARPTPENYSRASAAYMRECVKWPIWKRHCAEVLGAGGLTFKQVAYTNCLPFRTESQSGFDLSVARNTAALYVRPLLDELAPAAVIALGKRAAEILALAGPISCQLVVWNRSQAATAAVRLERAAAAALVMQSVQQMRA
jgi:hypothetical protein